MPSKESIQKGMDSIFGRCSSYFIIRKGVRKEMAIDYKKEWEKLVAKYGYYHMHDKEGKAIATTTLGSIMSTQIRHTINEREKLMQEYVREERITTEIDGGEKHFYNVQVIDKAHGKIHWLIGNIHVHKADFATWCKKKRKEVK